MEILQIITFGLLCSLLIGAIRQSKAGLAGVWLLLALSQSSFIPWAFDAEWFLVGLPIVTRLHFWHFFQIPIHWQRELINWIPVICLGVLLFFFQAWWISGLKLVWIWETWRLIGLVSKTFKQRGITFLGKNGARINWVQGLVLFQGLVLIMFLTELPLNFLLLLSTGFTIFSTWIFANPEAFQSFASPAKYVKSNLDTAEKARLLHELDHQLRNGNYLLQPDASLKGLAKLVGTNGHNLSQLLNESKGVTFFELQSSVRVREAKKLLQSESHQHLKIEEIANEVGYASKSSFNTTFKKITGKTPSEFRESDVRSDKVERSTDGYEPGLQDITDTFGLLKNSNIMLSGFFKIYYRNLLSNKAFSFINLFGLVLGFTSALLVWVYLRFELSYDRFHADAENIYRVAILDDNPQTRTPHPLAQAMVEEFSQVEAAVSLSPIYGPGLTLQDIFVRDPRKDEWIKQPGGFYADSTFFDVFDFELIVGNDNEALSGVGNVVISESIARKFYGDEDPLGKEVEAGTSGFRGVITGVFKDVPANSHFHPEFLVSYMTIKSFTPDDWWFKWQDPGHFNYVKLKPGANPTVIEAGFPDLYLKYDQIDEEVHQRWKSGDIRYLGLQAMTDIHLNSDIKWELEKNGNMTYIYILLGAIVFILVITSINFINLSTARVVERGKEIGIRKTLGARESAVSIQLTVESIFSCLAASFIAFLMAWLLFSDFSSLAGRAIPLHFLLNMKLIGAFLALAISIGMVSGFYPAISVAKIKSSEILKGKLANQSRGLYLRRGLVAVQFCVSAILIFGSLVIFNQIMFLENKELGFESDEVIIVDIHTDQVEDQLTAIKQEMRAIPGVIGAGGISNIPGSQFNQNGIFREDNPDNRVSCAELRVDFDALTLLGVNLKEGRFFEESRKVDSIGNSFIINETAWSQLQSDDIFDETILWDEEVGMSRGKVVGVLEDFHFKSLHEEIRPLIIKINEDAINYIVVKVEAGTSIPNVLQALEKVYSQFDAQFSFEYSFLDQTLEDGYEADRQAFAIFNLFTGIALLLSVMGLAGLAYLLVSQKTREIGIRKVMGARIADILWHESRLFFLGSLVSLLVGLPTAYFLMRYWLENFAYQISIGPTPFGVTIVVILTLVVLCVAISVFKTTLRNPSQALRYE